MKRYRVSYERDETGMWVAQAQEEPAAITQGRTIAEARRHIREALSLVLGKPVKAEQLVDDVRLPAQERELVQRLWNYIRREVAARKDAKEARDKAVAALSGKLDLGDRDVGELLGLSFQRVAQIRTEKKKGGARAQAR
ncbi:MAG: type II toxin-antitoxin system HicB family antitoxin [Myxococcaceae bacterium]